MSTPTVQPAPELMTADEAIVYLRLDGRPNPPEALRSLVRRAGLPREGRGQIQLFRKSSVDAWLAGDTRKRRSTARRVVAPRKPEPAEATQQDDSEYGVQAPVEYSSREVAT